MGSVSNPGFANLTQILAGSSAWLASAALLSPTAQSDLQNGALGDLVQLSDQALQLQAAPALFAAGVSSSPASLLSSFSTPAYSLNSLVPPLDTPLLDSSGSLLDALSANLTSAWSSSDSSQQTGSNAPSGTSPLSDQLAAYQAQLQLANTQTLFGLDTAGSSPGVNLLA